MADGRAEQRARERAELVPAENERDPYVNSQLVSTLARDVLALHEENTERIRRYDASTAEFYEALERANERATEAERVAATLRQALEEHAAREPYVVYVHLKGCARNSLIVRDIGPCDCGLDDVLARAALAAAGETEAETA